MGGPSGPERGPAGAPVTGTGVIVGGVRAHPSSQPPWPGPGPPGAAPRSVGLPLLLGRVSPCSWTGLIPGGLPLVPGLQSRAALSLRPRPRFVAPRAPGGAWVPSPRFWGRFGGSGGPWKG